jgi:hypothetical protein
MLIGINSFNSATNMYCISKPPCEISLSISIFFSKTNKYNRCSHCTCFYVSDGLCVINKCRICGMISVDMQYFPDSENMFFFVLKLYIFVSFFRRKLRIIFSSLFSSCCVLSSFQKQHNLQ